MFRLVATDVEQLRIDYGSGGKDTVVISPKATFRTDGDKIGSRASANFAQLDVTGLFFAAQLRHRAVRVERSDDMVSVGGAPARRIRVEGERSKNQPGLPLTEDRVDLYVNEAGLLTAISRTFYEGRPERYTVTFLFSEYRKTGNVWLPYRIEAYLKGQRRQTFHVEQYVFDTPVSREQFEPRRPR